MDVVAAVLVGLVAALHLWFLVLQSFLWQKPLGRSTFGLSREDAATTAPLAANQGLYNGFLAAGLVWSLIEGDPLQRRLQVFFLACILLAAAVGAVTVSRRILLVQGLPALLALLAVAAAA
jgi:putative membrane protein